MVLFSKEEILSSGLVQRAVSTLFAKNEVSILDRPGCVFINLKKEREDGGTSIFLLKPNGYTANSPDVLCPHQEMRRAKVIIKGGIRPNKNGFNPLKKCVKFCFSTMRDVELSGAMPFAIFDVSKPYFKEELKTARQKFFVVRENGVGFYHNLVNLSSEWIMLIEEKEYKLQKTVDLTAIDGLPLVEREYVNKLFKAVKTYGDAVFEREPSVITKVASFDAEKVSGSLVELLNVPETGMHEPCSIFAVILKVAKRNPLVVLNCLKTALKNRSAPKYYLEELIKKVEKMV